MRKLMVIAAGLILFMAIASMVSAHSGRTNKNGCHTDSKTGISHCH